MVLRHRSLSLVEPMLATGHGDYAQKTRKEGGFYYIGANYSTYNLQYIFAPVQHTNLHKRLGTFCEVYTFFKTPECFYDLRTRIKIYTQKRPCVNISHEKSYLKIVYYAIIGAVLLWSPIGIDAEKRI